MGYLAQFSFATDVLLMCSLGYFCYRFFRSQFPNAKLERVRQLETSIRTLITQAEEAGRDLNEQLLRRQQGLERALEEVTAVESRISRSLEDAETQRSKMQNQLEKLQDRVSEALSQVTEVSPVKVQRTATLQEEIEREIYVPPNRVKPPTAMAQKAEVETAMSFEFPELEEEEVVVETPRTTPSSNRQRLQDPRLGVLGSPIRKSTMAYTEG